MIELKSNALSPKRRQEILKNTSMNVTVLSPPKKKKRADDDEDGS